MTNLLVFDDEVRRSIVQEVTDGDTTHAPSGDAVYGAIASIPGSEVIKIVTDKGTASASTMGKLYIELGDPNAIYYSVRSGSAGEYTYSWRDAKDDILDGVVIPEPGTTAPGADVQSGAVGSSSKYAKADHQHSLSSAYAAASHSHTISDLPTANSITDGDTTHVVTADVIYDYIDDLIGDIEEDMLS